MATKPDNNTRCDRGSAANSTAQFYMVFQAAWRDGPEPHAVAPIGAERHPQEAPEARRIAFMAILCGAVTGKEYLRPATG